MSSIREVVRKINTVFSKQDSVIKTVSFVTLDNYFVQSTIIANLAMMYGRAGKSVLIINTDFQHDSFKTAFQIESGIGLSNYLNTEKFNISDIVFNIPGQNVSLVNSGSLSDGYSNSMIDDPKFNVFLDKIKQQYDYVLINTPEYESYESIENSLENSDGVIITATLKKTKKKMLYGRL